MSIEPGQLIRAGQIIKAADVYDEFSARVNTYITECENNISALNSFITANKGSANIDTAVYVRDNFYTEALTQLRNLESAIAWNPDNITWQHDWHNTASDKRPRHLQTDNDAATSITGRVQRSDYIAARHCSHLIEALYQVVSNIRNIQITLNDITWAGNNNSTLVPFNDFVLENPILPPTSAYALDTHKFKTSSALSALTQYKNRNFDSFAANTSRNVDKSVTEYMPNVSDDGQSVTLSHYFTPTDTEPADTRATEPVEVRRFLDTPIFFDKSVLHIMHILEYHDEAVDMLIHYCGHCHAVININEAEPDAEPDEFNLICYVCSTQLDTRDISYVDYEPTPTDITTPAMKIVADATTPSATVSAFVEPNSTYTEGVITPGGQYVCTANIVTMLFNQLAAAFESMQTTHRGIYFVSADDSPIRPLSSFSRGELGYPFPLTVYAGLSAKSDSSSSADFGALTAVTGFDGPIAGNNLGYKGTIRHDKYGTTDEKVPVPQAGWTYTANIATSNKPPMPIMTGGGNRASDAYYTYGNFTTGKLTPEISGNRLNAVCWHVPPRLNDTNDGYVANTITEEINNATLSANNYEPFDAHNIECYYIFTASMGNIVTGLNNINSNTGSVEIPLMYAVQYSKLYGSTSANTLDLSTITGSSHAIQIAMQPLDPNTLQTFTNITAINRFEYSMYSWCQVNETWHTHDGGAKLYVRSENSGPPGNVSLESYAVYRKNGVYGDKQTNTSTAISRVSGNVTVTLNIDRQFGKYIGENDEAYAIYGEANKFADYYSYNWGLSSETAVSAINYPTYPTTAGGKYMYEQTYQGKAINNQHIRHLLKTSTSDAGNKYFLGAFSTFCTHTISHTKNEVSAQFAASTVSFNPHLWHSKYPYSSGSNNRAVIQGYHAFAGYDNVKINDEKMTLVPRPTAITAQIVTDPSATTALLNVGVADDGSGFWWNRCKIIEIYASKFDLISSISALATYQTYAISAADSENNNSAVVNATKEVVVDISNEYDAFTEHDEVFIKAINNYGGYNVCNIILTAIEPEPEP